MGALQNRYAELESEVEAKIHDLVDSKGVESKHSNRPVLKIEKDNLMFNLEGGRYLTEIGYEVLVDNNGYEYHHSSLTLEQLCEIVDELS